VDADWGAGWREKTVTKSYTDIKFHEYAKAPLSLRVNM
jgi:hypothetical protein